MTESSLHPRRTLVAGVLAFACAVPVAADDWPGLRGPNHDGSARRGSRFGAGPGTPVVRWRARLGSGYSGVAVSGGRAVTMFSDGGDDVLAAFDEASGKELWRIRDRRDVQGHQWLVRRAHLHAHHRGRPCLRARSGGAAARRGPGDGARALAGRPAGAGGSHQARARLRVVAGGRGGRAGRAGRRAGPRHRRLRSVDRASDAGRWATTSSNISRRPWSGWGGATSWSRSVTRG